MDWARVLAPLSGTDEDGTALEAARVLAAPFGAEVRGAYCPADPAELTPWMGEGFMGGVQVAAMDSFRKAATEGEARARASFGEPGPGKSFAALTSPVWAGLGLEARLADVVVFSRKPPCGKGPHAEFFRQILIDERRPVVVAKPGLAAGGHVAVAWDGGKEASRAARSAIPWLAKASAVTLLAAPASAPRAFCPERMQEHLAARGVRAEVEVLPQTGEPAPLLLYATQRLGANLLVAGAFGHPRLQEFIFGGTTRALLSADGPALFLSH
jgi:nucleotide-binding universal stress UspA family protein